MQYPQKFANCLNAPSNSHTKKKTNLLKHISTHSRLGTICRNECVCVCASAKIRLTKIFYAPGN